MESIFDSIYRIDLENDVLDHRNTGEGDIDEYIKDLISQSMKNENKRSFEFLSDTVEVYTLLKEIISSKFDAEIIKKNTQRIAKRLFEKEKYTQDKYKHIMNIQKGSVIQSCLQDEEKFVILIGKVEHEDYIDEEDFNRQIGLPFENRILKTFILHFSEPNDQAEELTFEIDEIFVADSNTKIANYWYSDFLELKELNSDQKNTKDSFKIFDREIKKIKNTSSADYNLLRNNLIGYYKTQPEFKIDEMVNHVFGTYEPQSSAVEIGNIKDKFLALPSEKGFDTQFTIKKDEVKARRTFVVNDKIEIRVKDYVERMKDIVHAKEERGEKYIVIKTNNDEVYNMFKYRDED